MRIDTAGNTINTEVTIDGVTYELWNTEGGRTRVVDEDSGMVIGIANFKDFGKAEAAYDKIVRTARTYASQ